jgi:hypothetical protein
MSLQKPVRSWSLVTGLMEVAWHLFPHKAHLTSYLCPEHCLTMGLFTAAVLVSFLSLSVYKAKLLIWTHSFKASRPWYIGPAAFRPVTRKHIMVGAHNRTKLLDPILKNEREEKGLSFHSPFKCTPAMTWRPSTRPYLLLKVPTLPKIFNKWAFGEYSRSKLYQLLYPITGHQAV